MTVTRETELETENRMLREQVACLERVVGQLSAAAAQNPVYVLYQYASGYWCWPGYQVTSGNLNVSGLHTGRLSPDETAVTP